MQMIELQTLASRALKPASKKYRDETLLYIKRTWGSLEFSPVSSINPQQCLLWSAQLKYFPTRFNAMVGMLRNIFQLAIDAGEIVSNPASVIDKIPVKIKPPKLPSKDKFRAILHRLKTAPQCQESFRIVMFTVGTGMRIGEVRKLTREEITDHGIRIEDQKNGEVSYIPLLPPLKEILKDLPESGPLFKIKNPRRALQTSCRKVGVEKLTNHHLRHLFATHCIECGVDIKTVAHWLRHKDNGALALKRYAHVRDEHSERMAKRVKMF